MKTLKTFTAFAALAGSSAFAQLAILPPSSNIDGVPVFPIELNAGSAHWGDPATLGAYDIASDAPVALPGGLTWGFSAPAAITSDRAAINTGGGTIRAIFAGESAGWYNDFGYTYSGNPSGPGSFTIFSNIQALSPPTVSFGDHVDIGLTAGLASTFDFWFNATDSFTTAKPVPPTSNGGIYTVFDVTNSTPYVAPGNVKFAQTPLLVSTYDVATASYENVATYLVSVEDWRLDRGSDRDFSDFIFALQFFDRSGHPFGETPVPEPATYGLMGAIGLLGLAAWRRRNSAFRRA